MTEILIYKMTWKWFVEMALNVTKINTVHSLYHIICHSLMFEQLNVTEILVYGFSWNGIADELNPLFFIMHFYCAT